MFGCGTQIPQPKVDLSPLKESVVGLGAWVRKVDTTVGDVNAQMATVLQRTDNYDAWALRIMAAGPWVAIGIAGGVPLLCYVVPKIGWKLIGWTGRLILRRVNGRKSRQIICKRVGP